MFNKFKSNIDKFTAIFIYLPMKTPIIFIQFKHTEQKND